MQRQIKFRAYNVIAGLWIENLLFQELNFIYNPSSYIKIMQYTGLKDKNDVEIYEGDVVESTLPKSKFFDDIAKVVFRKGSFMMKSVEFEDETSCLIDSEQFIEVIGNIYENEELLDDWARHRIKNV